MLCMLVKLLLFLEGVVFGGKGVCGVEFWRCITEIDNHNNS
jgi:hypothetical protein